jgi:hypothetical protein
MLAAKGTLRHRQGDFSGLPPGDPAHCWIFGHIRHNWPGETRESHENPDGEGRQEMALARSFKERVQKRVASDPAFGEALLREGIDTMLAGDVDTGKAIQRDYIKATVGFDELGEATGTQPKSLIRMFGPRGNPQARNLFGIIGYLQKQAGVELHVRQGAKVIGHARGP